MEDWRRIGGFLFTGVNTKKITADPKRAGHLFALSNMKLYSPTWPGTWEVGGAFVWESFDYGENWRVIYSGNTFGGMEWYAHDTADPSLLWMVTTRSIVRMIHVDPAHQRQKLSRHRRRQVAALLNSDKVPSVSDVVMAAMRYTGVEPTRQLKYRRRSRFKALVPRLDVSYTAFRLNDIPVLDDGIYSPLPFRARAEAPFTFGEFRAMLSWDFSSLVFNLDETLFGRVDRVNGEFRSILLYAVKQLYTEYRTLRMRMLVRPPKELRLRVAYKLRLEEIASYINFATGGYLERYKRGDRPSAWDTPWFEPWSTVD